MPTARGRVIRDQLLAVREEARAERAAGGAPAPAAGEDPNQHQPRFRTREELEGQLAADRAARRAAHKERNERAAEAEASALRESNQARTERLRRNRLNSSSEHKKINARASASETTEREQLNRRRAAELGGGKGGVGVRPGEFRHGEQGQKVRKDLGDNKSMEPEENKQQEPGENKDKLEGVRFASPEAKARAEKLGLEAGNFKRRRAGGKTGFTTQDVERIGELAHEGDEGSDEEDGNQ